MNVQREYDAHAQHSRDLGVKPGESSPPRMLAFVLVTVGLLFLAAAVVVICGWLPW